MLAEIKLKQSCIRRELKKNTQESFADVLLILVTNSIYYRNVHFTPQFWDRLQPGKLQNLFNFQLMCSNEHRAPSVVQN